ncbi:AbiTii domain-containing protein [Pseudomonas nunensis]|uniref:AbiTii domain-containing protein n=1 Tax=Pseudomonas nunensis TaxID=2961896 RepID=UPI0006C1486D|nr:hypothetical protein [Pseudomonas nunensis]KOX99936.1 hypothetical protein AM274_24265 [Pseudomonas nunensis]
MTSLVRELVNAAINDSVSSGDLLRRALVVARRLDVHDLIDWISCELNGYNDDNVPQYRKVVGQLKAINPVRGTIPLMFPDAEFVEQLSTSSVVQSLPTLVDLAKSTTGLISYFPPGVEQEIMSWMTHKMRPVVTIQTTQVHTIIEAVRSKILELALDLEAKGILGEGMTFTSEERQLVQEQHYHFGDVSGSQIQISSSGSTQTQQQATENPAALMTLIEFLHEAIERGQIESAQRDELQAEVATLRAQALSPKPKGTIIKETAKSIKSILENMAGGVLAAQALPLLAPFI